MGKQIVKTRRLNWDSCCYHDLATGNGFLITEPADMSLDGEKRKSLYGPRSVLYGTTYSDEQSFAERYRCDCGAYIGRVYEGEWCENCQSYVRKRDINISFTGWISLEPARVIAPLYYNILANAIGKKVFDEAVRVRQKVDRDGHRSKVTEKDFDDDNQPLYPYSCWGVDEIYNNIEDFLDYFIKKKKNTKNAKILQKIRDNEIDNIFTSHIPVYSTFLRPQSMTSESFYYTGVDRHINTIFKLSEHLKDSLDIERPVILSHIQYRVNALWDINFDLLNGKDGHIRDQLLGGGLNYTSRNVIVPDISLRDDEIDMSYHTFYVLFKNKIIRYIQVTNNCTLSEAKNEYRKNYHANPKMLRIMQMIVDKEQLCVLINRNPTLNYYSLVLMSIRYVKEDDDDFTLSIPLSILPGLNADFDGDILNIIGCQNDFIKHVFRKFRPIERMIISRDSGYLNEYFSIAKEQKIDLYAYETL